MNPTSLDQLLAAVPSQNLDNLIQQLQKLKKEREEKIIKVYGRVFCDIVGAETILKLPEVDAKELHLHAENDKYYPCMARPSHLKDKSAVRGINGRNCPFIAIKIEMLNSKTREVIAKVVEVFFKRYGNDGHGRVGGLQENNYVTTLYNMTDDDKRYTSSFSSDGTLLRDQSKALRDLLDGKEVVTPVNKSVIIRMAKQ